MHLFSYVASSRHGPKRRQVAALQNKPHSGKRPLWLFEQPDEFADARVREILAEHGWFQTVLSDLPHFTFLGLKEEELPTRGLKNVEVDGQKFWIPDVG